MTDDIISSSLPWSETDRVRIARIARLVIGDDPEALMPSVTDPGIFTAILNRAIEFDSPIRRGLDHLDRDIESLSDSDLQALLEAQRETRSLLRALMQVVAQSYYENPTVLAKLGFNATPPFPTGHIVESGDWSLLDQVRERYKQPTD